MKLDVKLWFLGAVLASASLAPAAGLSAAADRSKRFDTVVIDAGHGGDDHGARGAGGLLEKDLVLDVARRLEVRLLEHELRVVLTRSGDQFVPLEKRTSIANDTRADLFVSIHANATRDTDVRGIETFFLSLAASDEHARGVAERENRSFDASQAAANLGGDPLIAIIGDLITTEHMAESNEFARLAQAELAPDAELARGIKQAHFVVLEGVQMPASLVEIGFLTNRLDERQLQTIEERDRIVSALVRATLEFGRRYDARRGVAPR
jgi:N-acetylmuramoyl-L-alanine amidase